jgi:hypothetical protein
MFGGVGKRPVCAAINQGSRPNNVFDQRLGAGLGRQPSQLRMRPGFVAVAQAAKETFVEAVLLVLARRDVMPADRGIIDPRQDGIRGQARRSFIS